MTKVLTVKRHIEDNLQGEFMNGIHCFCSPGFFDALTTHSKVKEAYSRWKQGQLLFTDSRAHFTFSGVSFEEYRGQARDADGNLRKFIADDEAHFFPLGTVSTFRTYFAPADFIRLISAWATDFAWLAAGDMNFEVTRVNTMSVEAEFAAAQMISKFTTIVAWIRVVAGRWMI